MALNLFYLHSLKKISRSLHNLYCHKLSIRYTTGPGRLQLWWVLTMLCGCCRFLRIFTDTRVSSRGNRPCAKFTIIPQLHPAWECTREYALAKRSFLNTHTQTELCNQCIQHTFELPPIFSQTECEVQHAEHKCIEVGLGQFSLHYRMEAFFSHQTCTQINCIWVENKTTQHTKTMHKHTQHAHTTLVSRSMCIWWFSPTLTCQLLQRAIWDNSEWHITCQSVQPTVSKTFGNRTYSHQNQISSSVPVFTIFIHKQSGLCSYTPFKKDVKQKLKSASSQNKTKQKTKLINQPGERLR